MRRLRLFIALALLLAVGVFQTVTLADVGGTTNAPVFLAGADSAGLTNSGTSDLAFGATVGLSYLAVDGNYAYVLASASSSACSSTGNAVNNGCELKIFDISNPQNPTYVGGGDASGGTNTGTGSADFFGAYKSGNYLFVGQAGNATACSQTAGSAIGCEFKVWDVSTPSAPSYVAGRDVNGSSVGTSSRSIFGTTGSGNFVYSVGTGASDLCTGVSLQSAGCEIKVWDVTTPTNPSISAGVDSSGTTNGGAGTLNALNLLVVGNYLYITLTGSATVCAGTAGSATGCELETYDITTPASISYVEGHDDSGHRNSGAGNPAAGLGPIAQYKNYIYTVRGSGSAGTCNATIGSGGGCEVKIFDISNQASSTYVGGIDSTGATNGGGGSVAFRAIYVNRDHLYVGSAGNTTECSTPNDATGCELKIFELYNPISPKIVGLGDSGGTTGSGADSSSMASIVSVGDYIYITKGGLGGATACSDPLGCEFQVWEAYVFQLRDNNQIIIIGMFTVPIALLRDRSKVEKKRVST